MDLRKWWEEEISSFDAKSIRVNLVEQIQVTIPYILL